jgi:hypothetical protein
LISVVILAIISTMTAMNIKKSVIYKKKIELDLDDYAAVRDALAIITRDINHAFHWADITEEIKKQIAADYQAQGKVPPFPVNQPGQATTNGPAVTTDLLTVFTGDKESLYLTTLSHSRIVANSPESDQAKVGYYLKSVKAIHDGKETKGLIRAESSYIDGDMKKFDTETVLLEHMKAIKFRYLGGEDIDWVESWKSDSPDAQNHNLFPDAVEVTLSVDHDGREITMSTVAAVHMPNNNPFTQPSASPGSGAPGAGGGGGDTGGGLGGAGGVNPGTGGGR